MKKNAQLARLVDKLNKATRLLAETASALTVEVESRHRVIDMLSSMPAAGRAQAAPKASAKAKAPAKAPAKAKTKARASTKRRGRPAGTGRFETRADLEAFVHGCRRTGAIMSVIADKAGVSIPVVVRILQSKEPKASRRATRRATRPADNGSTSQSVDAFSNVASPSGMTAEAAA